MGERDFGRGFEPRPKTTGGGGQAPLAIPELGNFGREAEVPAPTM